MKALHLLKLLLLATGLTLCVSGLVGIWLRLSQKCKIMTLLAAENAPEYFLRYPDYWYRLSCLWLAWLGLVFVLSGRDPVRFAPFVRLCGLGLIVWAAVAVVVGHHLDLWRPLWLTNAIVCTLLGAAVRLLGAAPSAARAEQSRACGR